MGILTYRYIESSLEENKKFLNQYTNGLYSRYDTYLGEHIYFRGAKQ